MVRDWGPHKVKYSTELVEQIKAWRAEGKTWIEICELLRKQYKFIVKPGALSTRISLLKLHFPRIKNEEANIIPLKEHAVASNP